MKELLMKWAELEPRFLKVDEDEISFLDGYPIISWREWQSIIQQAIEARNWRWAIQFYFGKTENAYGGSVWVKTGKAVEVCADTATEALLKAYLHTLEAVKTQEVTG